MNLADSPELAALEGLIAPKHLRVLRETLSEIDRLEAEEDAFIGPRASEKQLKALRDEARAREVKPTGVVRKAASLASILGTSYVDL